MWGVRRSLCKQFRQNKGLREAAKYRRLYARGRMTSSFSEDLWNEYPLLGLMTAARNSSPHRAVRLRTDSMRDY